MRAKGEALQRSAELWERGAEGEQATADVLASLPRHAWTVFHDVRWPGRQYANVDHVVVGPTGVFVIDSKNWSGSITVRENVLRQNGRSREAAVFGAAEAAIAVSQVVPVVIPQHVYPVLCFVRPDPLTGWARDVIVTSTSNLLEMLTSRPVVLPPHIAQEACLQLDAMFRSATRPPASSQPPPRRPQLPPTNPRQRQGASPGSRARRPKRIAPVRTWVALAVLLTIMLNPQAVTAISEHIGELLATLLMDQ